ncbi:MAG: PIN domain-containing protein [Chloroflexi bacterium]|nr:PIN domain-containing protein [Chloroflexota bacterium]
MIDASQFRTLLDADVLYRAAIRDILLQLAKDDLIEARWTARIHDEWMEALARNRPEIEWSRIERLRNKMDAETRDPLVVDYECLIDGLHLPEDPNDRHVLAAAIVGKCTTIVTFNLDHFPVSRLEQFGITAEHPDTLLRSLLKEDPEAVCASIRRVRVRLEKPAYSVEAYLENLDKAGLCDTAHELWRYAQLLG